MEPLIPASPTPQIQILVDDSLPGVLELRAAGVVTLPDLRAAHASLAQWRPRHGEMRCLLFDASAVERFGRGAVVESSRWITRHADWFDHAVVVTHSPSLKSAALALGACAPTLQLHIVEHRDAALAAIRSLGIAVAV